MSEWVWWGLRSVWCKIENWLFGKVLVQFMNRSILFEPFNLNCSIFEAVWTVHFLNNSLFWTVQFNLNFSIFEAVWTVHFLNNSLFEQFTFLNRWKFNSWTVWFNCSMIELLKRGNHVHLAVLGRESFILEMISKYGMAHFHPPLL